jgi:hypothetical protein
MSSTGVQRMSQLFVALMFAAAMTFLTFAATFAEPPRSEVAMLAE